MRFSSGRFAIPDAKDVGGGKKFNLIIATFVSCHHPPGLSICWSRESRFRLKSLDPRSLGSSVPLSFWFSI